jgi:hypothetical protein
VSIRPGIDSLGATAHHMPEEQVTADDLAALELPLVQWPANARRILEFEVIVALAGDLAEWVLLPPPAVPQRCETPADQIQAEIARLPEGPRRVVQAIREGASKSDEELVAEALATMHSDSDIAIWHRNLLDAICRKMVLTYNDEIRILADQLDLHGVLSGAQVDNILDPCNVEERKAS